MGVFKRGEYWCIDYYYQGRRIKKRVSPDHETAKKVLRKTLSDIAEKKYLDIKKEEKKVRFDEFVEQFKSLHSGQKKSAGSYYKNALVPLMKTFKNFYLHEITTLDVEKYKSERVKVIDPKKKAIAPATVNRELALLKCIFNRAIEWNKSKENPVKRVKLFRENNKRDRYLSKEEISVLLSHCSSRLIGVVLFAINTGLRKGEIQNLLWQDIHFDQGYINIRDSKNGENRKVPMNQTVKSVLIAVPKHPQSQFVFCGSDGVPYNFRKSFQTAIGRAKITNFRFHDLRHTFASHLVMSGVDLNTVRELLGHKSLDMTLRYAHLSPDHKGRAVELLSSRMGTIWEQSAKTSYSHLLKEASESYATYLEAAS